MMTRDLCWLVVGTFGSPRVRRSCIPGYQVDDAQTAAAMSSAAPVDLANQALTATWEYGVSSLQAANDWRLIKLMQMNSIRNAIADPTHFVGAVNPVESRLELPLAIIQHIC